jgi:hypothetical protein
MRAQQTHVEPDREVHLSEQIAFQNRLLDYVVESAGHSLVNRCFPAVRWHR